MASKRRAALLGASLFALAVLELVARSVHGPETTPGSFMQDDPVVHHRHKPGLRARYRQAEFDTAFDINALGLREREIPATKPPGERRILILGDSFTAGLGVEATQAYPRLLQRKLDRAALAERWQVINAGVSGYSPLLEHLWLRHVGLALEPDLVILSFDLSDVHEDIQYTVLASFDARGIPAAVAATAQPAPSRDTFLRQHLRSYDYARQQAERLWDRAGSAAKFSGDVQVDRFGMLRRNHVRDERDWSLSYEYLLLMRDTLLARGIDFWLVVYPYGVQVSPREWSRGRRFWGFEAGAVYPTWPQQALVQFGRDNGLAVIDLCPAFERASKSVYPLYLASDGHFSPAGHELVAAALYPHVAAYTREELHDSEVARKPARW